MRGKGIHYDTGTRMDNGWTRETFDSSAAKREMQIIANELHCTAVRITGSEPERLAIAAGHAAEAGLEVWLSPFPCGLTTDEMLPLFVECATRAEDLRRNGGNVTLIAGGELSLFGRGFVPGDTFFARVALFTGRGPELAALRTAVTAQLHAFLGEVVDAVRAKFGGKLTYASLPFERVDWTRFDYVAVDAYRVAENAATYVEDLRSLHRHGLPVVVTEFGCCAYRGAADLGARGFLVVDQDAEPWRLDGEYQPDEQEQVTYLRELLQVFKQENVDTAFWFTFAGFRYPHHPDPRYDLDIASFGVVRVNPDTSLAPKASFHALAAEYGKDKAR